MWTDVTDPISANRTYEPDLVDLVDDSPEAWAADADRLIALFASRG